MLHIRVLNVIRDSLLLQLARFFASCIPLIHLPWRRSPRLAISLHGGLRHRPVTEGSVSILELG
jgi:hypothetical protein